MFDSINLPLVRKMPTRTIAQDIEGMSCDEVAEAFANLFKKIKSETGYTVVIDSSESPINSIFSE